MFMETFSFISVFAPPPPPHHYHPLVLEGLFILHAAETNAYKNLI